VSVADSRRAAARIVGLGGRAGLKHRLTRRRITVGSAPDNALVIDGPSVSRHHAVLKRRFGRWRAIDLESTNGTFVNGKRIGGPTMIGPGDELRFGLERFAIVGGHSGWPGAIAAAVATLFVIGFAATYYLISNRRIVAPNPAVPAEAPPAVSSNSIPAAPDESAANASPVAAPEWLKRLNHYRTMAGVPIVAEDSALSLGDYAHARYMVENFSDRIRGGESLGAAMHSEDPGLRWYSIAGRDAAMNSDVVEGYTGGGPDFSQDSTVDGWIAIPFHRLPLLSPLLKTAGYGQYCQSGVCVAALNAQSGAAPIHTSAAGPGRPVAFPPAGSTIDLAAGENEWPDPLTACASYAAPNGLAITLQLGMWIAPQLTAYTIERDDGTTVEACGFDATSYTNPDPMTEQAGRGALQSYGAVVVIPREPLRPGIRYTISLMAGGTPYKWSFTTR